MKKAIKVTFGKFEDDCADIVVGGKKVGWLEREWGEEFASASSRQRKKFVSGYAVNLDDDEAGYGTSFKTKDEARAYTVASLEKGTA